MLFQDWTNKMYFIFWWIILGIALTCITWSIYVECITPHTDFAGILALWGIGLILFTLIIGFGAIPSLSVGYEESSFSKDFTYTKTPTSIVIEYLNQSGNTQQLIRKDIETYLNPDKMRLKITKSYNYYGKFMGTNYSLVK